MTLYGSAARDQHRKGKSDINLLILLKDAGSGTIARAAEAMAKWVKSGEPAPLLFSEAEWKASTDVFPLEIEDMREAHKVIRGSSPFTGITTQRGDLRRQLEHEVRGKLLHLRTEYAALATDGKALGALLENSLGTFLVLFRATLRLARDAAPPEPEAVIRATSVAAGLDASAFDWPLARRTGKKVPELHSFDPTASRYVDQIEKLALFVNQL
ncbi:MAG: hypothetical protein EXR93_08780 [Gemmatimonadetes bacterium]|nr:hypothetical protein [Gemmatimonadota bacterium]